MEKVLVLLSTYNGDKYLEEQIQSLLKQKGVDVDILVRDDGSNDNTRLILNSYQKQGVLKWYTGDNLKPARSFMDLMQNAGSYPYYAFCDQDDVWLEDKLVSAVESLKHHSKEPSLYFSQTQLVDENLRELSTEKLSPLCSFSESMIESIATGCTFVINKKMKELTDIYNPSYISMHDYWLYRLNIAVKGFIYYDPIPHILYRQHSNNVIGLNKDRYLGVKRRIKRIVYKERQRSKTAEELLKGYSKYISKEEKEVLRWASTCNVSVISKFKLVTSPYFKASTAKKTFSAVMAVLTGSY